MERFAHPTDEDIEKYIFDELEEDEEIKIGEHLAECNECVEKARNAYKFRLLWESLSAETHGKAYWEKKIEETLEKSYQAESDERIKEKIRSWIGRLNRGASGFLEIIIKAPKGAGKVINDISKAISFPAYSFVPVKVVRGERAQEAVEVISDGRPEIHVIVESEQRKVLVEIEESIKDIPLIILASEKGIYMMALPKKVEGTRFYSAVFSGIPEGRYILLIEPKGNGK